MSITPVTAKPAPSATSPSAPSGDGAGFADLVQQHLGEGGLDAQAATAVLHEAASPTAAPSDGLASVLSGLVAGTAGNGAAGAQLSSAVGVVDDASGPAAGPAAGSATGQGAGVPVVGATLGAAGAVLTGAVAQPGAHSAARGVASGVPSGVAPGSQRAVAGTSAAAVPSSADGAASRAAGGMSGDVAAGSTGSAHSTGGDPSGVTAPQPEVVPSATDRGPQAGGERGGAAGAASATTTPAAGPTGVASGPSGIPTAAPDPQGVRGAAITDQVFDHVTRLVSRGDGTHRITLRLHPADLGEVQVTLTARDGTVDVTLAAGSAAREALREGSPQLRSLLELTGATTGQVVIREPSGSAAAQQQAFGSSPDQGQQPGRDAQGAATHDDAPGDGGARDGASGRGTGAGTPYRSNIDGGTDLPGTADPATRGPLATPSRLDLNL